MNKAIYAIAVALMLGTTYAIGDPGGEGNNTGCNGQGNPNSPCQPTNGNGGSGGNGGAGGSGGQGGQGGSGGQGGNSAQGQLQGQLQAQGQVGIVSGKNKNNNNNSSRSASNAGAYAGSASNSAAVAAGGTSGAISGGNEQSIADNSETSLEYTYNYKYDNDYNAASAASVYGDVCTGGMSGQVEEGGFAITNPNAFCNYMAAAMIYRDAFEWEMTYQVSEICAEPMSFTWPADQYMDTCMNERAKDMLSKYYENLENANEYMEMVEIPAKVDGIFGYLVRPIATIAVLILLI